MENHKYDDIISLPHHVSMKHSQMSRSNRAAQFAPFAALTGYEDAIKETARITQERIEIDEYEKEELNRKIQWIREHHSEKIHVSIRYFEPDVHKSGGRYQDINGKINKINEYEQSISLKTGEVIPIGDIISLEIYEEPKCLE